MGPTFNPTGGQITAAQNLFIAMAFNGVAKEAFENFETQILSTGEYHYSDRCYDPKYSGMQDLPEDRIIRKISDTCHMKGLVNLGNPLYEGSNCDKYYKELGLLASNAGFVKAENGGASASFDVTRCEVILFKETKEIHKIDDEVLCSNMSVRKKVLDLLLGLFANLVQERDMEYAKRKYFNERMNPVKEG